MSDGSKTLTNRGLGFFRRLILLLVLLSMLAAGLWMLSQVMDAVTVFGRGFVNFPGYPAAISVWFYHDLAFALLWGSFALVVAWEVAPWKASQLTGAGVLIALFAFAMLTAGLWLSQDIMNAALVLHRTRVDLPFFAASLDLYQTRDLAVLLTTMSFVMYYALNRAAEG